MARASLLTHRRVAGCFELKSFSLKLLSTPPPPTTQTFRLLLHYLGSSNFGCVLQLSQSSPGYIGGSYFGQNMGGENILATAVLLNYPKVCLKTESTFFSPTFDFRNFLFFDPKRSDAN